MGYQGTPQHMTLPAGSLIYRVCRQRHKTLFCGAVADSHFGGGRFDPTADDTYPYLYATLSVETAFAESVLYNLPFDNSGARILPKAVLRGRRLVTLITIGDLTLIALRTTKELAAVGQDEWLVQAEHNEYDKTRRWARWLRQQSADAHGIIWPSKRDIGGYAILLFGDRCQPELLRLGHHEPRDLDDPANERWLNKMLAEYRVAIYPYDPTGICDVNDSYARENTRRHPSARTIA